MKTCVIYAAYIPDSTRLNVLREFCSVFKREFSDADFYVGINPGSVPNTDRVILESGVNVKRFINVPEHLNTNTDASAFQAVLYYATELTDLDYDVFWFGHTKGAAHGREQERLLYLNEYFSKRKEIEEMFEKYSLLGSYGLRGNYMSAAGKKWDVYNVDGNGLPICGNIKFNPFNYTHVNWSYVETMYTLRAEPVKEFIKQSPKSFFETKLDPWYFETVMPWVPCRYGLFPYVKQKRCFWNTADLPDTTKTWIEENKLDALKSYLDIP